MDMVGKLFLLLFLFVDPGFGSDIPTEDGVLVLTTDNFKEAIELNELILVEFYAPWCGHCKALTPTWEQLGDTFKNRADIMIAKLDATSNSPHDVLIESYPTLILFKGSIKNQYVFKGRRTFDGLLDFLKEHGIERKET